MTQTMHRGAGTLPGDLTSFVGRRQAAADVKRALSASRLVTLIGVGGVGKSRLALRVGHELRRAFPDDGTWLVELAAVNDPALVPRVATAALGLLETSAREPEASLASYLADASALIVLDNCEHVLDGAAGAPGAQPSGRGRPAPEVATGGGVSGRPGWPADGPGRWS
jgi:hypothetical protein